MALFELVPVPPGALPPPGARIAVALRSSTLSLAAVEDLVAARDHALRAAEHANKQLEAARAELLRERAARLHAEARAKRRCAAACSHAPLTFGARLTRLAPLQAACDALRFPPSAPPVTQLAQLRLQEVAVGGAALVGLEGIAPQSPSPRVAAAAHALRMHAGAALAEHADGAPAPMQAVQCRFARV